MLSSSKSLVFYLDNYIEKEFVRAMGSSAAFFKFHISPRDETNTGIDPEFWYRGMEFSRRNLEAATVSLTSTPGILKIQLLRSRVVTLRF